jgi:translation initiation factor 2B subunit (eIF-2B alpha/beta/delta family)
MAAQSLDVPVYVLAGSEKCLPLDSQVNLEEERKPADEILERAEPIEVLNFYFDRTPLHLVSGVITERGVLETGVLKKQLESLTIHPFLVDCLKERQ